MLQKVDNAYTLFDLQNETPENGHEVCNS